MVDEMVRDFDIVVIGSGPAGEKSAIEAASLGAKVAVVEKGSQPGGASVITGTIPSKSILETVTYLSLIENRQISGIDFQLDHELSIKELMHRKNVVTENRIKETLQEFHKYGITYIQGVARFVNNTCVQVISQESGEIEIRADKIVIAAGTRPYHPDDIQFDGKYILDSDTILNLKEIPKKIAIFGGGVIGCEYAAIFAKLGSSVHLIDPRGTLLDFLDRDCSTAIACFLQESGIDLRLGENYRHISVEENNARIVLGSGETVHANVLLYANGRQGNADLLSIEKCGLEMNSRSQLDVNRNYQTAISNIYAVGDIIGFPSLVSAANQEGRQAAQHAVTGRESKKVTGDIPIAIYTIPQISMVGETEQELTERKVPYEVGMCQYMELARAKMIGDCRGFLKLIFHAKTKKLLGVHIIGQLAAELIHIGQSVILLGGGIDYFIDNVMNFPTLSLAYKIAAKDGISRVP